jgi:hypothetical protein
MLNRLLLASVLSAGVSLGAVSGAFAFANPDNNGNTDNAPGQIPAKEICAVLVSPGFYLPTGDNTGNDAHDPMTSDAAVTNCSHFWDLGPD